MGVSAGTKAIISDFGKRLIDEGTKHAPDLYRFGKSKIENENVRKTLESDAANYIVEETQKRQKKTLIVCLVGYKKWARVSSVKNIGHEDIENNFVGVFPSNHRNKFINHKLMISEKKRENIH